jgi:hypothetical protein
VGPLAKKGRALAQAGSSLQARRHHVVLVAAGEQVRPHVAEHEDLNAVMLAVSLAPAGYLEGRCRRDMP